MLKNYLKVAVRNLFKSKIYSFINIAGLAISISACILIYLWVQNELSYDKFNKNSDRIYRVYLSARMNRQDINAAQGPLPMGETLQKECPEIEAYTRIWTYNSAPVIRYNHKVFNEKHFLYADSSFFKVFTAEFISGDAKNALAKPGTIVITESTAHKYFGNDNPVGKILNIDKNSDCMVTGVIKDFPSQSHFNFDFLGSLSTFDKSKSTNWMEDNCYTYFLLRKGADPSYFQKKLDADIKKYLEPQLLANAGVSIKQLEANGSKVGFFLQSLTSIHLHSHLGYEIEANSDISYIYIFSSIAVAILILACINFINLSTARSEKRAKEVGVRKALGSYRKQITLQHIIESVITSLLAVIISIVLIEFIIPLFNDLAGKNIKLDLTGNAFVIPSIVLFAVFIGIMAGAYPAFYLASFQPIKVLKNSSVKSGGRALLRSGLVIFQFVISIVLIIGTFIIYNQLEYIQEKNLGFNKEQVVVIKKGTNLGNNIFSFMHGLVNNPGITSVSNSSTIPGEKPFMSSYKIKGDAITQMKNLHFMFCDYDFFKTYQMQTVRGRFFSKDHPSDINTVIINEAAAKIFGVNDINGKFLTDPANHSGFQILGIVKNFNFASLHQEITPMVIFPFSNGSYDNFISIRIKPGKYLSTINSIKNEWKKYAGDESLEYSFLDQNIQNMYLEDLRTSKIAAIFSALAVFIACLGLFGLATYIIEQRTKEIGIRKVLGASEREIIVLLSKEFVKWVLLANIIAWPIAYYFMTKWLQDFAYKSGISFWTFLLAGLLALIIALVTVSTNAIKAARANPIKSLKYE